MAQVRPSDDFKPMDPAQPMVQPQPVFQPQPMAPYVPPMQQSSTNTTVVIGQQPSAPTIIMPRGWHTDKGDCCDDTGICMCVLCCPLCHSMMLSQKAGESMCLPLLLPGTWLIALRTKIREKHNIQGSIAGDCCEVSCYGNLVECQLARELKYIEEVQNIRMMAGPGAQVMQHI